MATRNYSAIALDTTLASSITSTSTTMLVTAVVGYPTAPFVLAVDYNASTEELVLVTAITGTTLTITRGFNGTTAQSHNTGAVIRHVITAQDITDTVTHYNTGLTGGAHGVTGALATFLGTASSANLAALVTDETGTGNLVFNTSPTLTTPSITGATISGGSVTGATVSSSTVTGAAIASSTFNIATNAKTTSYTLLATDTDKLVTLNSASGVTLTVPSAVFSAGNVINIQQIGAGQVTVAGDGTSTVSGTGTKLRTQYSAASIVCTGTNTFTLIGDIQ